MTQKEARAVERWFMAKLTDGDRRFLRSMRIRSPDRREIAHVIDAGEAPAA